MGDDVTKRLAATVRANPERPAIAFHLGAWREWTYAELAERVRGIAEQLVGHGVGPGSAVAVVAHRHPLTIAAMLAVLRCGAHYVPMDPRDPPQRRLRLHAMAQVQAEVVPADLEGGEGGLDVAIVGEGLVAAAGQAPASAESPAYVMFTSGSTGSPRAVVVPHRAIVRLVVGQDFLRFDASRAFLQSVPLWFDASVIEVYGPLLNGGRCVLYPANTLPTPAGLREAIARQAVTTACLTASVFHWLVDHDAGCLAGLDEVVVGGEPLSVGHVRRALAALPRTQLINGYGPTENGVQTTAHRIPRQLPAGLSRIPIGRAIRGTCVVVVDDRLQRVAPGTEGELVAAGEGLALGYRGDDAATRERFVDVEVGGAVVRGYRTGDRVVEIEDGLFDFVGRTDEQVKIQGHRAEPAEAEAAIGAIEGVAQCRVLALPDPAGVRRLVAWLVLRPGHTTDQVAALAATVLPSFLVPSHFSSLERLPLNANGKLDRSALPTPWQGEVRPAPPRNPRSLVGDAWREVLGRAIDAVDVNFFDAGGRSLDAVRLHALLERICGRNLEATFVYEFPTQARQVVALTSPGSPS